MSAVALNLDAWTKLFSLATEQASQAISQWTHGDIVLSLDEIRETSLCGVAQALRLSDELATMVRIGIDGDHGGQLLLTFDDENARGLIAALLDLPASSSGTWTKLERSALAETGNIIGSVYLTSMSKLTGGRLWPTPPQVLHDYVMSVIEQAVMSQAVYDDRILLCRTKFECQGEHVRWSLIFVPSPEFMQLIETSLSLVDRSL